MSDYTAIASKVFTERYSKASYWSSTPQNTMMANRPIEIRIMSILYPGSIYAAANGYFGTQAGASLSYEGMRFILPTLGWEQKQISYGDYGSTWARKDWTLADLQAAGMPSAYAGYLIQARRLFSKVMSQIGWIPAATKIKWDQAISAGGLPVMERTGEMVTMPVFLYNNLGRQAAWNALAEQFRKIVGQVTSANLQALQNEMRRLESDQAFWDTVAAYSGVDKLRELWDDLKAKIRQFNKNKAIIEDNVREMNKLVAEAPDAFTPAQKAKSGQLQAKSDAISAEARAATSGPVFKALTDEGMSIQGLGIGPVVLIGMGVGIAVVVSTAAAFTVYISNQAALTSESNQALKDFISTREAFDQQQYALETNAIRERRAQLQVMLDSGQISQDSFNTQIRDLAVREQSASQTLMSQRQQTQVAATELNDNLKKAQEDIGAGAFLGPMKWIAVAGAVGAVSIFVIPRLLGKK